MTDSYLIVVGVDGSVGSRRALEWAAREAAARGGAVQAVIAWSWDGIEYGPMTATGPEEEAQRAAELLDREVKALADRRGTAQPVAAEVIEGRPADVLSAAASAADLLVLGSHGHSRVRHTVLGSVSEECIRKATCPVVVIPVPAERPAPAKEPALRGR
ncbi:nucleotide-binding universal stress UspA family protein [Krasilnikovia cinnamomea]|uniref:Nucleotide-binding universal stress UspA family protein n=1 Tax=Krasilnikovia cinnamomea TaxID=349313 RepID=A0A4Q7ZVF0_9ACTN|nr:universal stress protein [Krasilnikovia cinnamomea]RZU54599.1 nucleotide-binding universal stress UspA family protein [Krasilnikovia cinnamomea]